MFIKKLVAGHRALAALAVAGATTFGLLGGAATAQADTERTWSRGAAAFVSYGDTIVVEDRKRDGQSVVVWVADKTNGHDYLVQCSTGGHRAPHSEVCTHNYPEGHKLKFDVYAWGGPGDSIKLGTFYDRA
ncbi:hypothetical protein [Streptomyces tubercidicus]|uniref:hypothetical protein n=1 Tax=Streptomyces tubercidicus TaxID=47759 RepID=UPI003696FD22